MFSPKNSIIRQLFQVEEPEWPLGPIGNVDWNPCLQTIEGHDASIYRVHLFRGHTIIASVYSDDTIKLWSIATGQCVQTLEGCFLVAFSAHDTFLASSSGTAIEVWDAMTGNCIHSLDTHDNVRAIAFLDDGETLAFSSTANLVQLWSIQSGQCVLPTGDFSNYRPADYSVAFSDDGSLIALSGTDDITVLQTTTGTCIKTVGTAFCASALKLSHDGSHLAYWGSYGAISINLTTGHRFRRRANGVLDDTVDCDQVHAAALSHNGTQLALGFTKGSIEVWDTTTYQLTHILRGHHLRVTSVSFNRRGVLLVSAADDGSIKLWNLTMYQSPEFSPAKVPRLGLFLRAANYFRSKTSALAMTYGLRHEEG